MTANRDVTYKTCTIKRVPFEERRENDHITCIMSTLSCSMGTEVPHNELMPTVQTKMKEPMVGVEEPKCGEDPV